MTKLQNNIRDFMLKAGQVVREKPSIELTEEERELRVKLILEEALEFAYAMGVKVEARSVHAVNGIYSSDSLAFYISPTTPINLVEAADAVADLNYVVNGSAVALGIDMEPIDEEVHASNMSKFIDGHRREDGKWVKGPSYRPANIKPLIEAQQNASSLL